MFDLTGKLALVTGSARGIGEAIAVKLAEAGADVVVHGRRDSDRLRNVVKRIRETGRSVWGVYGDTSDPEEICLMFDRIGRDIGMLDILVNNAAVLSRVPFLELTAEEWDKIMDTNARGYFLCSQYAAKMMIPRRWGRIINISSISQSEAAFGRIHYCASKAAIGMLTKGIALELAKHHITANAILPGSIYTDFNRDVLADEAYYRHCVEGIPVGRIGKPEDIAGAAVMLASDEASYISGAEIVIDGAKTVF